VVNRPVEKKEEEANNKRRSKDSEKDQRDEREKISTFLGEESFGGRRRTRDQRERETVLIITKIDGSDFGWEINRTNVVKQEGITRLDDMA